METESFRLDKKALAKVRKLVYTLKASGSRITIAQWIEEAITDKIVRSSTSDTRSDNTKPQV